MKKLMSRNISFDSIFLHFRETIKSDYFFYAFGEIVSKSIDFLVLLYITRLISPSDYGLISIAYATIPILIALYTMNIPSALIRKYYDEGTDFEGFLTSNLIFVVSNGFIIMSIIIVFSGGISILIEIPKQLVILSAIVALFRSIYEFGRGYLQAVRDSKKYAIITFIYSILLNTILVILLLNMDSKLYLSKSYADLFTGLVISIIILSLLFRSMNRSIKVEHLKYSLMFSAPLIIHTISNVILGQIDRIMINSLIGSNETGIYSLAYNLGMVMILVILAVNKGWLPTFYKNISNIILIETKIKTITVFIFVIAGAFIIYSDIFISIFILDSYKDAMSIFPIIIVSFLFVYMYIIYSNYLFYYKKTMVVSINSIIVSIINIVLNYFLLQKYGYSVAAVTTLISYLCLFILHYFSAKRVSKENLISISIFIKSFAYFTVFLVFVNLVSYLNINVILILLLKSIILFMFMMNFKRCKYF